jgi:hypothetical protein
MLGRAFLTLVFLGWFCAPSAEADCRCRGSDGTLFQQGEIACIKTTRGTRLARCEMFLNNSTWTVVRDDCPTASATSLPHLAAPALIAAAPPAAETAAPHTDLH